MAERIENAIESMNGQLGQVASVLAQLQSQMSAMSAENAALRSELAETRGIALAAQAMRVQALHYFGHMSQTHALCSLWKLHTKPPNVLAHSKLEDHWSHGM